MCFLFFVIACSQDCKVVVVWPVKKTPDFMKDLYSLSAPFGSVVKHSLSTFKQEVSVLLWVKISDAQISAIKNVQPKQLFL